MRCDTMIKWVTMPWRRGGRGGGFLMGEQIEGDESLVLTDTKAGLQAVFGFR